MNPLQKAWKRVCVPRTWQQTKVKAGFRGALTDKHDDQSGPLLVSVSSSSWSVPESRDKVKADSTVSRTTTISYFRRWKPRCTHLATLSVSCRCAFGVIWKGTTDMQLSVWKINTHERKRQWIEDFQSEMPMEQCLCQLSGSPGQGVLAEESHCGQKCRTLGPTPCSVIRKKRGALWRPSLQFDSRGPKKLTRGCHFTAHSTAGQWVLSWSRICVTHLWFCHGAQQPQDHLGASRKCCILSPTGDTLPQDLQLNKISRWFVFYLRVWEIQNLIQRTQGRRLSPVAGQRTRVPGNHARLRPN